MEEIVNRVYLLLMPPRKTAAFSFLFVHQVSSVRKPIRLFVSFERTNHDMILLEINVSS
jgi:hypothetical protein